MPTYSVPGADELTSTERVPLVGNEDYIAKVLEISEATKPDFNGKMTDFLVVKFGIESFKDGAPLEDMNGDAVEDERWMWKDFDAKRMGFKQDGTAGLARQFFLAANGIADLTERIPDGDTDELVGRKVVLRLIVKPKKTTGKPTNAIVSISPLTARGRGRKAQEKPAIAEVSDEYATAVASLVSGEDRPSSASVAQTKAALSGDESELDDLPF